MDGTPAGAMEDDKENCSPSPSKSLYPRLPPPPPSPINQHPHQHQQTSHKKDTPNTSHKRARARALTSLLNSPPRPSYADKVRGVFRAQAQGAKPKVLHRWDGFGRRVGSEEIVRSSEGERGMTRSEVKRSGEEEDREVRPWSPLGSGDEGLGLVPDGRSSASEESVVSARSGGGDDRSGRRGEDVSVAKPAAREEIEQAQPATMLAPIDDEVPPAAAEQQQEEEPSTLSPAPPTEARPPEPERHQPAIPSIQEPLPSHDSSSDSWTGDDEFLPRSARRQKTIDRRLPASSPGRPTVSTTPSTQLLRPQAPAYTSVNFPVARSGARASRFAKLAVDDGILYPELPRSPAPSASDHRASDADDEDSNSS